MGGTGADLIQSMSVPLVWSEVDLDHILKRYGTFIVVSTLSPSEIQAASDMGKQERTGTDLDDALASLQQYKDNIYVIQQIIQNDVSSTKIRLFLRRGEHPPLLHMTTPSLRRNDLQINYNGPLYS